jgi:hypothetical protein
VIMPSPLLPCALLPCPITASQLFRHLGPARRPSPEPRLLLGDPGRCGEQPTLVITVFDDSGSVTSPAGADPVSNRYQEARQALRTVARRCRCGQCLGSVLHFDLVAGVPPTALTKRLVSGLEAGLRPPADAVGCSVLGPSLSEAYEITERYPEYLSTLVVLSDFELFDPNVGEVLTRLAAFPGDVHAVVLGRRGLDGGLDPRIQVTPIRRDDPPGALAQVVFASLTAHRVGRRLAGPKGADLTHPRGDP